MTKYENVNVAALLRQVSATVYVRKDHSGMEINDGNTDNTTMVVHMIVQSTDARHINIYSGYARVHLVDIQDLSLESSPTMAPTPDEHCTEDALLRSFNSFDIDQMPVILAESTPTNEFQVDTWDSSRSPGVYNHYASPTNICLKEPQKNLSVNYKAIYTRHVISLEKSVQLENGKEVQELENNYHDVAQYEPQRNDNISHQKKRNKSKGKVTPTYSETIDEDSDGDLLLSQVAARKYSSPTEKLPNEEIESEVLKQLIASESSSKQRKTIMFVGKDSTRAGQTIQKISYNDPKFKCTELDVDNEVIIDDSQMETTTKKKYQCEHCKQIFKQISAFRQHMKGKHTSSKAGTTLYTCKDCGKNLKMFDKFQQHCLGHGDPQRECPKCHKVYSSFATLKVHLKIHNRKYPCTLCTRSYETAQTFRNHMAKFHMRFICSYEDCPFVATSETVLNDHLDDHKYEERMQAREENQDVYCDNNHETVEDNDIEMEQPMLDDGLIDYDFATFDDSVKSEIGTMDSSRSMTIEEEKIMEADTVLEKIKNNKIFLLNAKKAKKEKDKSCPCGKSFDRVSDMKRHFIEHIVKSTLTKARATSAQGLLHITCVLCHAVSFDSVDKYKAHLREHAQLTLYTCTICDKSFSDSSNFSKHTKIHGDSTVQCDLCRRRFHSKDMLARHMEKHNTTEPVKCKLCDKSFHFPSMLNKHVRTAHRDVENTYACKFCDDVFHSLKAKWDHEWCIHNLRKLVNDCEMCDARFRKYSELKRHYGDIHHLDANSIRILREQSMHKY